MGEEVVRINADDDYYKFENIDEHGIYFKNTISNKIINLRDSKACWWRRRGISQRSFHRSERKKNLVVGGIDLSSIINGEANIFQNETERLIEYIYTNTYANCPINIGRPPIFNLNRLVVMDIAKRNGLRVPSFDIVTSNKQLRSAVHKYGNGITKAISDGLINIVDNNRFHTYSEIVEDKLLNDTDKEYIYFPSLVSQKIEKTLEIRTFYLDGLFYSMSIASQSDEQTAIDFRKYNYSKPNRKEPYKLPLEIEAKLKSIFSELELNCGSVDFIIDKNGDFVFLEINPVGQYWMVSHPCNYNLDFLIANYLRYGRNGIN